MEQAQSVGQRCGLQEEVPRLSMDARLRQLGAPLFGTPAQKKERLARYEHYAFKRVINEQIKIVKAYQARLKTDFGDASESVSVPDISYHGHSSLY